MATIIGSGIVILDGTVVNLALPHIAEEMGASFTSLQWIVDGYLLSLSAFILLGGSLGDIFGRKKVYMIGLAGFGVTSLLCGLAPNTFALISIRILQGLFGALLVPGGLAIINTNFLKEERSQAMGRWTAWSALSAAVGPLLGGYIVDVTTWRWIFLINVPLIAVCLVLAHYGIKESKDPNPRQIDAWGAALAVVGLAGITFGLIEGPAKHWNLGVLAILAVGFISFTAFILAERRRKDPMVKLRLFASRNFTGANITTFAMYGALGGFFFALVIYLQSGLGYSGIKAGTSLVPVTITLLLLSGRVGKLAGKYGARLFMTIGPLTSALGMVLLYNLDRSSGYLTGVFPGITLFGLGLAITVSPLVITVMGSVTDSDSGIASGINNAVARVAGLIVIALLGLFGVAEVYQFTIILCASMAALAGVLSFIFIRAESP